MDVRKRPRMRDTMLALLLAVLQGLPIGEAAPNPSPLLGSNWGNPRRYVHLQTSTDFNTFYLEIRLDGTVCRATARTSYSKLCFWSGCSLKVHMWSWHLRTSFQGGEKFTLFFLPCRCNSSKSWNTGANGHLRRQKQPLLVHGFGGQPFHLGKANNN